MCSDERFNTIVRGHSARTFQSRLHRSFRPPSLLSSFLPTHIKMTLFPCSFFHPLASRISLSRLLLSFIPAENASAALSTEVLSRDMRSRRSLAVSTWKMTSLEALGDDGASDMIFCSNFLEGGLAYGQTGSSGLVLTSFVDSLE
jgi:hypothetical protein